MSFRPIVNSGDPIAPPIPDEPLPELQWLPIDRLVIDESYQRPLLQQNVRQIERIAQHFSWSRFTPCLAAPAEAEGWFALIDGQHRTHAALMVGHTHVPAQIVPLDAREQAAAFAWVNGEITAVTPFQVYKAALAAGEDWALRCESVVSNAGARLMTYAKGPSDKQAGEVYSIKLVREHVEAGCGAIVTHALNSLWRSDKGQDPRYWSHGFLQPLLAILPARPEAIRRDLSTFLSETNFQRMFNGVERMLAEPKYVGHSRAQLTRDCLLVLLDRWLKKEVAA